MKEIYRRKFGMNFDSPNTGLKSECLTEYLIPITRGEKEMEYFVSDKRELIVLDEAKYKDYNIVVVNNSGRNPCAYVEIPKTHPFYQIDCWEANKLVDKIPDFNIPHGMFTFSGSLEHIGLKSGYWLGWDYAHAGDRVGSMAGKEWTRLEILKECCEVINSLEELWKGNNE